MGASREHVPYCFEGLGQTREGLEIDGGAGSGGNRRFKMRERCFDKSGDCYEYLLGWKEEVAVIGCTRAQ